MQGTTRRDAMRESGLGLAAIAAMLAAGSPAAAQAPPATQVPVQLPPTPEINLPAPSTQAPTGSVSVDARGAIAPSNCPFETSTIRLKLSSVRFTRPDGTALQPEIADALAGVLRPVGDQSIRAICTIRDAANAALRRGGWVASVMIPPQSIAEGELKLQVVTARITEVRVTGTPGPYRRTLEKRIAALRAMDPLNERDAERALLLAGDVPGLDVQLSLRPAGTQPGDVIGELLVTYRPFAILANTQNYNSTVLGRVTGYVRGELYGVTGLKDVLYVGASSTSDFHEQVIAQGGYTVGIGEGGLTAGPRIIYAWSRPSLGLLDLKTDTLITGFDISKPLKRSINTNVRVGGGFDYVDQRTVVSTTTSGNVPLNLDKLRILFANVAGDTGERRPDGSFKWTISGDLEVRKGLGIFGATPVGMLSGVGAIPSRVDGDSRAVVVRGDLNTSLALGPIFSVSTAVRGQWSNHPLLNYEEFSLGNLTIGRGYDPGSNSGDRAVGLRVEPAARVPLRVNGLSTQLFGFYDAVYLTNLDQNATEVDRHLRSYGGGARLTLFNKLLLEAIYAHPQDKALKLDKAPPPDRALLSLTVKFDARAR